MKTQQCIYEPQWASLKKLVCEGGPTSTLQHAPHIPGADAAVRVGRQPLYLVQTWNSDAVFQGGIFFRVLNLQCSNL